MADPRLESVLTKPRRHEIVEWLIVAGKRIPRFRTSLNRGERAERSKESSARRREIRELRENAERD